MKQHFTILAITALTVAACGQPETAGPAEEQPSFDALKKAECFLGRWENTSEEGTLSEIWERESDSSFTGASYFVIAGDTVFSEKVRLVETNGKLVYTPVIADQNNGNPVDFTLTHSAGKTFVFENPQHDYPKKIRYVQQGDSLTATISGGGKQEVFAMKKTR